MNLPRKVVGLSIAAIMAMSALVAMSASATTPANSHFTSEAAEHHLILKGTDAYGTAHQIVFFPDAGGSGIACTHTHYHGTLSGLAATTTQTIQLRPTYTGCGTETGTWGEIVTHVPTTCGTNVLEFTSGTPGTLHINCEMTKTHPNCTIKVPKQTVSGAHYTTETRLSKHSLTIDINTSMTTHYESGICVFLGTTHTHTMQGSFTLWGEKTDGTPVGITHT